MKTYGSYLFKDKDPAIDQLRTIIQQAAGGAITNKALTAVERDGGPTASCMHEWFFGKTKRPTNATLEAAGRAVGFQRTWTPMSSSAKAKVQTDTAKVKASQRKAKK